MADRFSRKMAASAARNLARACGKPWGHTRPVDPASNGGNPYKVVIGGWRLDWYNGGMIEEITSEGHGLHNPFGPRRYNAEQFVLAANLAADAVEIGQADLAAFVERAHGVKASELIDAYRADRRAHWYDQDADQHKA